VSTRQVAKRLQSLNVLPRKSKRGVWSTSTLVTLLKNKTYIGEGHYGATYAIAAKNPVKQGIYKRNKKTSRGVRAEEEWIKIPTPTLIERDVFERVQAQLARNRVFSIRNRKNEYLLAGKIRCVCGAARGGEGPLRGKHLYYRCSNRVLNYPLPRTCNERGINARIADQLVWDKLVELMSSPDLIWEQAQSWQAKQERKPEVTANGSVLKSELAKLNEEETRYVKAYGAGLLGIEKLQELVAPIKQRRAALGKQIAEVEAGARTNASCDYRIPDKSDMAVLAKMAPYTLTNLCFDGKREIVLKGIDAVVGTQENLNVYGHLQVTDYVNFETSDRDGVNANRHIHGNNNSLPFAFTIKLPPPDHRNVKRTAWLQ